MLQAQRWDPTDADAQVVLGVLYNVSRDYDSAAEAFTRALETRPNDHSLWNKVKINLAFFPPAVVVVVGATSCAQQDADDSVTKR